MISTRVARGRTLIKPESVDGPDLMLTVPMVSRLVVGWVPDEAEEEDALAPDTTVPAGEVLRKSDLIKPSELLTLTLDQPAGSCSSIVTVVFGLTVLIILVSVDAPALRFTPSVVRNVALEPGEMDRKSDLMNPISP